MSFLSMLRRTKGNSLPQERTGRERLLDLAEATLAQKRALYGNFEETDRKFKDAEYRGVCKALDIRPEGVRDINTTKINLGGWLPALLTAAILVMGAWLFRDKIWPTPQPPQQPPATQPVDTDTWPDTLEGGVR